MEQYKPFKHVRILKMFYLISTFLLASSQPFLISSSPEFGNNFEQNNSNLPSVLEIDSRDTTLINKFNISLLQYEFDFPPKQHLNSLTVIGDEHFFLGAINSIFRVDLKRIPLDQWNDSSNGVPFKTFDGKHYLKFVPYNISLNDGPYLENRRCLPNITDEERNGYFYIDENQLFANNHIVHLFHFNNILFACGTARCGLCTGFSPDLKRSQIFGAKFYSNYSTQTDYDSYLMPLNFVGSLDSSLIFFGNHHSASKVLYTAFSNDGRHSQLETPFITSRVMQSYVNENKRKVFGFNYTRIMNNERSIIRLQSQNFYFHFITGFSYNRSAYFLFVEYYEPSRNYRQMGFKHRNSSNNNFENQWPRVRLGRLCEDDPSPLHSYMETTLKCEHFTKASAAHLSIQIIGNESQGYQQHDNQDPETLFIAFNDHREMEDKNSAICAFRMDQVEAHFNIGFKDCNGLGLITKWLYKLHNRDISCKYTYSSNDNNNSNCLYNSANRYIDIQEPLSGQKIIFIKGDHINVLGSIRTFNPLVPYKPLKKFHHIFAGTSNGLLYKFFSRDHRVNEDFVIKLPEPLLSQQNVTFDTATATFYLLTSRRLIRFPIISCSVYSTCASCFRSKLHRSNNDWCHWNNGYCELKRQIKEDFLRQPTCPPTVYSFEPTSGPTTGGTILTFYGDNFGLYQLENFQENFNSLLRITVGGSNCIVLERSNKMARCKISGIQKPSNALITFEAKDLLNISVRKFQVNGIVEIKQRFRFIEPMLKGIHPPYGPFIGGTKVLLLGRNLNIGNKVSVWIRDSSCKLFAVNSKYIVCEIPGINVSKYPVSKPIIVTIDNYTMKLESNNPSSYASPERILNDDDDEEEDINYEIKKRSKRQKLIQDDYIILNDQNDDILMQQLFLFRFYKLANEHMDANFNENFLYRPNPIIKKISTAVSIYSGNTSIEFFGENFQSIYYPELELFYPLNDKKTKRILSICRHRLPTSSNASSSLSCSLPPLSKINISEINENYYIRTHYRLHLDGYIKDSKHVHEVPTPRPITYYPDPKFNLFKDRKISTENLSLSLYGQNLSPELPYSIMINELFPCHSIRAYTKNLERLDCTIEISMDEIQNFIGKSLNVTVAIGSKNEFLGTIILSPLNKFKIKSTSVLIWVFLIILFVLIFILIGISFIWRYVRNHLPKTYDRVNSHEMTCIINDFTEKLREFFQESFPEDTTNSLFNEIHSKNLIITDTNRLKFLERMGHGEYGLVYKAILDNDHSNLLAVKISKDYKWNKLLLKEMEMMKDFHHINVMPLLHVTLACHPLTKALSIAIVVPYMHHHDLHSYVSNAANEPRLGQIINFSIQIAEGMKYLSGLNFVHRDLAARNCLLDQSGCVKISDFGLSRFYDNDKKYYKLRSSEQLLPIKWMALESLKTWHFTIKSDVWSYGVLVWELYTRGHMPYNDILPPNNQNTTEFLINYLENGYRLSMPTWIPKPLWLITLKCWNSNPDLRPTFAELVNDLRKAVNIFTEKKANLNYEMKKELNLLTKSNQFNFTENNIQDKLTNEFDSALHHYQMMHKINERDLFTCYENENLQDDYGNMVMQQKHNGNNQLRPLNGLPLPFKFQETDSEIIIMNARQSPPPYIEATKFSPCLEIIQDYDQPKIQSINYSSAVVYNDRNKNMDKFQGNDLEESRRNINDSRSIPERNNNNIHNNLKINKTMTPEGKLIKGEATEVPQA